MLNKNMLSYINTKPGIFAKFSKEDKAVAFKNDLQNEGIKFVLENVSYRRGFRTKEGAIKKMKEWLEKSPHNPIFDGEPVVMFTIDEWIEKCILNNKNPFSSLSAIND